MRILVNHDPHQVLAQRCVPRRGRLAPRPAGGHEQAEGLRCVREVKLRRHDLEQPRDPGARVAEELGPREPALLGRGEVDAGALAADLEDELGGAVVDVGAGVADPSGGRLGGRGLEGDADAALEDVLEAEGDLVALAVLVVADVVGDDLLLEALEVEVAAVAEELLAVRLASDRDGVAAEEVDELGEDVGGAVRDGWREDGGGPDEALAVEAGEEVLGVGEEDGEAEGEEVGCVAGVGEDVAGDLELAVADGDEDGLLVELGDELRYCLCLC